MYLMVYLKLNRIRAADFAKSVGASKASVLNWASGKSLPGKTKAYHIEQVTKGVVTFHDIADYYRLAHEDNLRKQCKRALGRTRKTRKDAKRDNKADVVEG